jgi:hypothetical protein
VLAAAAAGLAGRVAAQCPTDLPHVAGTWQTLPYQMAINPISATLLHSGKVFLVAGSENDAYNNTSGAQSYRAAVWDPTGDDQSSIVTKQIGYDVFCSGTAQLPHGRTLTIGGSASYAFTGESHATFFDPVTEQMSGAQSMADGRWYGTATALGDGRIMAFSGLKSNGATSQNIQIYDLKNACAGWGSTINEPFVPPLYPRTFLLPDGRLFFTSHGSGGSVATAWFFNPGSSTWTSSVAKTRDRAYGAGVILPLLPPSYTPKIMAFGGGPSTGEESTELIDLSAGSPSWTPKANMSAKRRQMNSVLLPNGKVLLSGGSQDDEVPNTPGKTADVYDPATNVMNPGGTAAYSRLYHSTALLLPDATVASLGSNPGPRGKYASAIEIYTPAYLFDANDQLITSGRPAITSVTPGPIGYGAGLTVTYTSSSPIASAVLMRPGSTTHAFDMEQRMVGLCGASPQPACTGSGTLTLTAPPNGNVAPPGYYMLFLLDASGVPSKAEFLELASVTANPPDGVISSPLSDVTIDAGGTVSFGTTTTATKYSWVFQGGSPGTSTAKNPGNVTFSTSGEYVVSLTVLDAANNSDPSPPTRKIKVLPGSANFDIAVTPAIRSVTLSQPARHRDVFGIALCDGIGDAEPVHDVHGHGHAAQGVLRDRLFRGRQRRRVPDRRLGGRIQPVDDLGRRLDDAHHEHDDERCPLRDVHDRHRDLRSVQPHGLEHARGQSGDPDRPFGVHCGLARELELEHRSRRDRLPRRAVLGRTLPEPRLSDWAQLVRHRGPERRDLSLRGLGRLHGRTQRRRRDLRVRGDPGDAAVRASDLLGRPHGCEVPNGRHRLDLDVRRGAGLRPGARRSRHAARDRRRLRGRLGRAPRRRKCLPREQHQRALANRSVRRPPGRKRGVCSAPGGDDLMRGARNARRRGTRTIREPRCRGRSLAASVSVTGAGLR